MALQRKHLTLDIRKNVNILSEFNQLTISTSYIDESTICRSWASSGVKSFKYEYERVIPYNGMRLLPLNNNKYLLLCSRDYCHVMCQKDLFMCKRHNNYEIVHCIKCIKYGCAKIPGYGYRGSYAQYCKTHQLDGMIDVKHLKCEHPNCNTRPNFSIEGEAARFCNIHKTDEMINTTSKRCEQPGCNIHPTYGIKGGDARFCKSHKADGMVDVKHQRCEHPDCDIRPTYGIDGGNMRFCKTHKSDKMIDVVSKRCEYPDCDILPTYGLKGGNAQYCKTHKSDVMIDVQHQRCKHPDCDIRPSYGKLYSTIKVYCVNHSTLNEYGKRKLKPKCKVIDCLENAYFVDKDDSNIYPVRCTKHKYKTDTKLGYKKCSNCDDELYFPKDKDICMNCGSYRERILRHFKELDIKYLFQSNGIEFFHDKRIVEGIFNYRPDFLIQSMFGYIIVEVDEHQHSRDIYTSDKEINRMISIYDDVQVKNSGREVLFIRYNPDRYNPEDLKGLQVNTDDRQRYLYNIIIGLSKEHKLNISLGVMYLFYDNYDGKPTIQPINRKI